MLFFGAQDNVHGQELWKSDGTADGTVMVRDINPDGEHSIPASLTNMDGTLFFGAWDGINNGLWKSDGTETGTLMIKDVSAWGEGEYGASKLFSMNGILFFSGTDFNDDLENSHGQELWKSDGTASGTVLVKDINPGVKGSMPRNVIDVNGTLFFTAYDAVNGETLWKHFP
jgi:ELWxxDGT repeat protein